MRYLFSIKKADLFSAVCTVLSIFLFRHLQIDNMVLFIGLVALFTLAMDVIYKHCK